VDNNRLELNLDELEAANGGSLMSEMILNNEQVRAFIRDKKIAGIPVEVCITMALDYLRSYLDKYISRDQVIAFVNKIYDSI
jgi:hypothetical protein